MCLISRELWVLIWVGPMCGVGVSILVAGGRAIRVVGDGFYNYKIIIIISCSEVVTQLMMVVMVVGYFIYNKFWRNFSLH